MSGSLEIGGKSVISHDSNTDSLSVDSSIKGTITSVTLDSTEYKVNLSTTNNFSITTSGNGTLEFYNTVSGSTTKTLSSAVVGQSGNIYLNNASNHTISAGATISIAASDLNVISLTGDYWLSYFVATTSKVLVTASKALT